MAVKKSANHLRGLPLLLASASPRRQELLRQIGVSFQIVNHQVKETVRPNESPREFVLRMSREKAHSGLLQVPADFNPLVLGADTIVVKDARILGKPRSRQDGMAMLKQLSGSWHHVLSAVTVAHRGKVASSLCETRVEMAEISLKERQTYWDTGEPADKSGGYAIQGYGAVFVKSIVGSYSGVVGLPVFETVRLLAEFGVTCWQPEVSSRGSQQ